MNLARDDHDPLSGNRGGLKRKPSLSSMMEVLKKCRITVTPGELRIKTDIADCRDLVSTGFVKLEPNYQGSPSQLRISFFRNDSPARVIIPMTFVMTVPRYYPHEPPQVICDPVYANTCQYVESSGLVAMPPLKPRNLWSSILGLKDILIVLSSLAQSQAGESNIFLGSRDNRTDMDMCSNDL